MNTSMKKYVKAVLNLVIALVVAALVIWLLPKVLVFFTPFILGWLIAVVAGPLVRFFEVKMKIRRKAGSAFVIIVVIGLVTLGGYLLGGKLVREIIGFIEDLPSMWASLERDIKDIADNLSVLYSRLPQDIQTTMNNIGEQTNSFFVGMFSQISTPTMEVVGNFAKQLPSFIIGIIMCLLSSYFFVAERGEISKHIRGWMPPALLYRFGIIKRSMVKAVGGYLKAQVKIEVWIYLLLIAGLAILKVRYAPLIAFGIAILDFLPFFGTGTVMIPWALIKFFGGDYKMTIGILVIWGVSQLVRQIIQPKMVGDSMGMPPLPTLFLLYIGFKLGGALGMIFAVPIGIILAAMYEEGAFDTTKHSIQILSAGINRFRKLTSQDMAIVSSYQRECAEEVEEQQRKEEQKR